MRHKHRLSHYKLLTADLGQLVPCGLIEVLPGDVFQHSASVMVRLSPMLAPVMHPITVRIHHFFVPHRLSWPDGYATTWENFITGGPDGTEANPLPTVLSTGVAKDLHDYFGIPTTINIEISALPLRAFNLVFNEWFRDQDLVAERGLEDTDVPRVSWEKDYFTTARPWAQRGAEVSLPLGTTAPVKTDAASTTDLSVVHGADGYRKMIASGAFLQASGTNSTEAQSLYADLTTAVAAKVNDLRRAFALQRFAEVRARFGARYTEYLQYLGVTAQDQRLQRPEYLGGGTTKVSVSEVLQTSPDAEASPDIGIGDMYGHGIAVTRSNAYRRRFPEHGYVLSLLSARPKLMFTEGVDRTFLRRDREDFWQKELEFIGQQQVLEQELFATATNQDDVFGYSDRYAEYRSQRSQVCAEFRTILDFWHLAEKYTAAPALNSTFVECNPSKRVFAEQTTHNLWMAVQHRLTARRLVSKSASARIL